jgi:hypothetical protein
MENGLLYTFSTIAQALGGAFALLSAFVLYRFQSMDRAMWDDSNQIRGEFSRIAEGDVQWFDTLRVQGRYTELVQKIEAVVNQKGIQAVFSVGQVEFYYRLQASVRLHGTLARLFRLGALTTGLVMAGSVAAIPFAHIIYCWKMFSWIALLIGAGGFTACLVIYWAVIKAALYRE